MDRESAEAPEREAPPAAPTAIEHASAPDSHEAPTEVTEAEAAPRRPKRKITSTEKAPSEDEISESLGLTEPVAEKAEPVEIDPLDALTLPVLANPKQRSQFSELRENTKKFRDQAKTLQKLTPLLQEFGMELPETPAEIEHVLEDFATRVRAAKPRPRPSLLKSRKI